MPQSKNVATSVGADKARKIARAVWGPAVLRTDKERGYETAKKKKKKNNNSNKNKEKRVGLNGRESEQTEISKSRLAGTVLRSAQNVHDSEYGSSVCFLFSLRISQDMQVG